MRKLLLSFSLLTVSLISFAQADYSQQMTINVIRVNDSRMSSQLLNLFNNLLSDPAKVSLQSGISSFTATNFDFINLFKSEKPGEKETAFTASFINSGTKVKYAFTAYYKNGIFSQPMLVKAATDRTSIEYYDLSEGKVLSVVGNQANIYTATIADVDLGNSLINRNTGGGCGQCVANCIADAYINHGWASVWATVQSIFVPATGVGIVLGCVGRCCINAN
ncbi:MAG: hypothetical protein SGI83_16330 [Bacteroidota bacterium]|nr:hypothetical protein [Bacteroidota bacterium]